MSLPNSNRSRIQTETEGPMKCLIIAAGKGHRLRSKGDSKPLTINNVIFFVFNTIEKNKLYNTSYATICLDYQLQLLFINHITKT